MCVAKKFWSKLIIVSLLTALVVKNSHILALTYFILLKKVERLSNKANFSAFFKLAALILV